MLSIESIVNFLIKNDFYINHYSKNYLIIHCIKITIEYNIQINYMSKKNIKNFGSETLHKNTIKIVKKLNIN